MANDQNYSKVDNDHEEEASPLLNGQVEEMEKEKKSDIDRKSTAAASPKNPEAEKSASPVVDGYGWTADGLPFGHGSVLGEPMSRAPWNSSILSCLGRSDEFCGSDLEVCELFHLSNLISDCCNGLV